MRATLDLTKKLFPWRSCTKEITGKDARPCLDYYIKRCIAPCTAYCTKEEYDEVIDQVILFLEGKSDDVIRRLVRAALSIKRVFANRDQDIEWAYMKGQIYIVQSRPYIAGG